MKKLLYIQRHLRIMDIKSNLHFIVTISLKKHLNLSYQNKPTVFKPYMIYTIFIRYDKFYLIENLLKILRLKVILDKGR